MLIVVRHGRTAANAAGELLGRRDPSLDEHGRLQARAIAAEIGRVDRVISSPLARCLETASAIRESPEVDERLIELDYGELEGVPFRDVPRETWSHWRDRSDWRPPGGESHDDLAARVWEMLDEIASDAALHDVVLVSHVSPIKAAVAWAMGVSIDISWRCYVHQASILRIGTGGPFPSLRSFNETAHLGDLL